MGDDAPERNEVICGGACDIKVIYAINQVDMVSPKFVPAGTGNVRRLEEVVFDLVEVATSGIPIILPEPMEEFRGFQERERCLAVGGLAMEISNLQQTQVLHFGFPEAIREVLPRDGDLVNGGEVLAEGTRLVDAVRNVDGITPPVRTLIIGKIKVWM